VNHLNQFTSVTFNFNLLPNRRDRRCYEVHRGRRSANPAALPNRCREPSKGSARVQAAIRSLPLLLLAAIFVMYVILGILYESYVHPFTVLFPAIVPAVVGGLATLYIFHSVLSLYSVIGLFLLLGIVKKNGIMVVDFALQRIDEGWDLRSAIHEASIERFRPIMMTTLAALMGAIPIALGFGQDAASRRPLGLVIVGGLIFSQLVTLFVTPVIYLWLEWFQEHVLDKVPFLRSAHYHEHEGEPSPRTDANQRRGRCCFAQCVLLLALEIASISEEHRAKYGVDMLSYARHGSRRTETPWSCAMCQSRSRAGDNCSCASAPARFAALTFTWSMANCRIRNCR
jgi:HAE1 family hydrophobic/amphiphilic exporter-1